MIAYDLPDSAIGCTIRSNGGQIFRVTRLNTAIGPRGYDYSGSQIRATRVSMTLVPQPGGSYATKDTQRDIWYYFAPTQMDQVGNHMLRIR